MRTRPEGRQYPYLVREDGKWTERQDVRFVHDMSGKGPLRNEWTTVAGGNGGKVLEGHLAVDGTSGNYPECTGNVATNFVADSEDVGLVLPPKGETLVGPKLAHIGNSGTLIFGEVQLPRKPEREFQTGSRTPGFFILDTTTGAIEMGLSGEEWSKNLEKAGLQGQPVLVSPERRGPRF